MWLISFKRIQLTLVESAQLDGLQADIEPWLPWKRTFQYLLAIWSMLLQAGGKMLQKLREFSKFSNQRNSLRRSVSCLMLKRHLEI